MLKKYMILNSLAKEFELGGFVASREFKKYPKKHIYDLKHEGLLYFSLATAPWAKPNYNVKGAELNSSIGRLTGEGIEKLIEEFPEENEYFDSLLRQYHARKAILALRKIR